MINNEHLKEIVTEAGENISEISENETVMMVFLRHFGCIFCQKSLLDLAERKKSMKDKNIRLVLIHMTDKFTAEKYFQKFGISPVDSISDPACNLYKQFGLAKGNFNQLFGLKNWVNGFEIFFTTPAKGNIRQIGDGFQMPGIFLIRGGEVQEKYIHKIASDSPDYDSLINCCVTQAS